jgi:hypothetical protein
MADPLECPTGDTVPGLELTAELILDRSVVFCGASGSGKTVFIKDVMAKLRGHIDECLIVSPSEKSNPQYAGYVPKALIHEHPYLSDPSKRKEPLKDKTQRFIQTVLERQVARVTAYRHANDVGTLSQLFGRLPRPLREHGLKRIQLLNDRRHEMLARFTDKARREQVNEKFRAMLSLLYKRYLIPSLELLWEMRDDMTDAERDALQNIQLNPRFLLIFDDCAAELKSQFRLPEFRALFYQGRHYGLTVVFSIQDDTDLDANLRKNVYLTVFTQKSACCAAFCRPGPSPETKKYVARVADHVFTGHRKMAFSRHDSSGNQIYHISCVKHDKFEFSPPAIWELCGEVESDDDNVDKNNAFMNKYRAD